MIVSDYRPALHRPAGRMSIVLVAALLVLPTAGCGDDTGTSESRSASGDTAAESPSISRSGTSDSSADAHEDPQSTSTGGGERPAGQQTADNTDFAPLTLNALGGGSSDSTSAGSAAQSADVNVQSVISQLQPLQILLGQWRGTTRRDYEGFKAVDNHEWIWDLQSQPDQPALVVQSDKSPYLRRGRITWDLAQSQFVLTAVDGDGTERRFLGTFTEPVHQIVGSDDKLHRVFQLEFTQDEDHAAESGAPPLFWKMAFVQQENNRYLLEVSQRRGKADFRRFDTVSTQREGTSFALSDSDYGEKTCIISEGLGTIMVSYQGRDYWVCCSGCKSAFEDDPATWIARAAARQNSK